MMVLMGFIRSVPIALEESAYIDGCNVFQVYFHIIMPGGEIVLCHGGDLLVFVELQRPVHAEFLPGVFPREKTITLLLNEISSQAGVNYGLMAASVVLIVVPVLLVYVFLQKHIIRGLTAGAIKG